MAMEYQRNRAPRGGQPQEHGLLNSYLFGAIVGAVANEVLLHIHGIKMFEIDNNFQVGQVPLVFLGLFAPAAEYIRESRPTGWRKVRTFGYGLAAGFGATALGASHL